RMVEGKVVVEIRKAIGVPEQIAVGVAACFMPPDQVAHGGTHAGGDAGRRKNAVCNVGTLICVGLLEGVIVAKLMPLQAIGPCPLDIVGQRGKTQRVARSRVHARQPQQGVFSMPGVFGNRRRREYLPNTLRSPIDGGVAADRRRSAVAGAPIFRDGFRHQATPPREAERAASRIRTMRCTTATFMMTAITASVTAGKLSSAPTMMMSERVSRPMRQRDGGKLRSAWCAL